MEIRVLISASNAPKTFDLRCEMREKMIEFIQKEYPASLPRVRAETFGNSNGAIAAEAMRQPSLQS
jgi:hypothetical protein